MGQPIIQWINTVATLATAIGVGFVAQQLWFGAWLKAQEIFTDKDFTIARKNVYARIPQNAEINNKWTEDEYMVCRKMDELARLAPYLGMFGSGERLVLKTWCDPLAKSWIVLHSLVAQEREKTPDWRKWDAFEKLGKKAMKKLNLEEIPERQLLNLEQKDTGKK